MGLKLKDRQRNYQASLYCFYVFMDYELVMFIHNQITLTLVHQCKLEEGKYFHYNNVLFKIATTEYREKLRQLSELSEIYSD